MTTDNLFQEAYEEAIGKVKRLRSPSSENDVVLPTHSENIMKFLDVGGTEFDTYDFIIQKSRFYGYEMLKKIIIALLKKNGKNGEIRDSKLKKEFYLIISNNDSSADLYFFKDFGLMDYNSLVQSVYDLKLKYKKITKFLICLVDDYAYKAQFNHNNDYSDPSRGTGLYSLKFFFEKVFSKEEYKNFVEVDAKFKANSNDIIGLSVTRNLTPQALFSFKKVVLTDIKNRCPNICLSQISQLQRNYINEQFINNEYAKCLVSNKDFAVSFLTAEWMFSSLSKAGNIDYSPIAMDYFKALEQFMFLYVVCNTVEKKNIPRSIFAGPNNLIELNDDNLRNDDIVNNITLGSLTAFFRYQGNKDLLRDEIDNSTYNYICTQLNNAKELRNGYFHKDNMTGDFGKNEAQKARNTAIELFYLLIGSYKFSNEDKMEFSIPTGFDDDYFKLCEYLNFHQRCVYYIIKNGLIRTFLTTYDYASTFDEYGSVQYTGAYFRELKQIEPKRFYFPITNLDEFKPGTNQKYLKSDLQDVQIYIGTIKPTKEGMEFSGPEKLIFDNGNFIGPEDEHSIY